MATWSSVLTVDANAMHDHPSIKSLSCSLPLSVRHDRRESVLAPLYRGREPLSNSLISAAAVMGGTVGE
jgi:hypothetical protein